MPSQDAIKLDLFSALVKNAAWVRNDMVVSMGVNAGIRTITLDINQNYSLESLE